MSEIYEAIVSKSQLSECRDALTRCGGGRQFRLHTLGSSGTVAVVAADTQLLDPATYAEIARSLSEAGSATLYVMYDNRGGVREARLFERGSLAGTFGESDELWARVGVDDLPDESAARYRVNELENDEEYECVYSAIDAGLAAVGMSESVRAAQLKELACYPTKGAYVSIGQGEI